MPMRNSYAGDKAVITGFGWNWVTVKMDLKALTVDEKGGTFSKLRYAQSLIVPNEICQLKYSKKIIQAHICAQVVQDKGNEGVCSVSSYL